MNIKNLSLPYFKVKYLLFITVYFSYNFANFSQIAETFWIKNNLSITAVEIVSITVWNMFPWTMKIVFGQALDQLRIFGSQRRIYIFLGAFFMLLGNIITILVANNAAIVSGISVYHLLVLVALLSNTGFAMQDIVADTLCYDIVDKVDKKNIPRPEEEIKSEIANIQVLIRIICIPFASLLAMYLGGIIAEKYSFAHISYFLVFNTIISLSGALIITKEPKVAHEKPNKFFIIAVSIYFLGLMAINLVNAKFSQELSLILGLTIVVIGLHKLCKPLEIKNKKEIFCILIVCFATRCTPNFGPGVEWWQIDELQFNPQFFAQLKQISLVMGFIGLWLLGRKITQIHIGLIFLILNSIDVILQLPFIGMAFGLHEWTLAHFGFGAKTLAFLDTSAEGLFSQLQFFLMCTILTYKAPKHNVALWFALSMGLMGLAYVVKRIINRYLAETYIVERGNYENIPDLMIASSSLYFLIPTITILIFLNPFKRNRQSH